MLHRSRFSGLLQYLSRSTYFYNASPIVPHAFLSLTKIQNTTRDRGRRDVMCEQEGVWSYLPLFLQMLRDGSARSGAEVGDRFDKLLRVSESSQVGSVVIHWLLYPTAAVAVFICCPCVSMFARKQLPALSRTLKIVNNLTHRG